MRQILPFPFLLTLLASPGLVQAATADIQVCASSDCTVLDNKTFGGPGQPVAIEADLVGPTVEVFSDFDGRLVATGGATAFGRVGLGSLHATAQITINVEPNTGARVEIAANSAVAFQDSVRVRSSSLASGTPVTLTANMVIGGGGRGSALLRISRLGTFLGGDSDTAGSLSDTLESLTTTFAAKVGDLLLVEMELAARVSCAPCIFAAAVPARALTQVSDYGNSAYLYLAGVDPGLGITFEGTNGYNYLQPAPVPLPGALGLFGAALLAGWRRRAQPAVRADAA